MIKSLKIDLTKNLGSFNYLKKIQSLPLEYNFKDGLNIIIGANGSGKSSILKVLQQLTLCNTDDGLPKMRRGLHFSTQTELIRESDGFDLTNDWRFPTAMLYRSEQLETSSFVNAELCVQKMNGESLSDGENQAYSMRCFNERYSKFIHEYNLEQMLKNENSNEMIFQISRYIEKHRYDQMDESMHSTILMDEPDKGLDVILLKALYGMLKREKHETYRRLYRIIYKILNT